MNIVDAEVEVEEQFQKIERERTEKGKDKISERTVYRTRLYTYILYMWPHIILIYNIYELTCFTQPITCCSCFGYSFTAS